MKAIYRQALLPFLLLVAACQTDADLNPDLSVTFDFATPVEASQYSYGDTVYISGEISANVEMHGYEVQVINTSNADQVLLYEHAHEDGVHYALNTKWANQVVEGGQIELAVKVFLDHEGNEVRKSYFFTAQAK